MPVAANLSTILERDVRRDGTAKKLSTIRQISEDLSRKRLIGLGVDDILAEMEDTFNNDIRYFSGERRYSNASFTSSSHDALWENVRRLSEVGMRRPSDASFGSSYDALWDNARRLSEFSVRRPSDASFGSSTYDALWDNARRLSEAGVRRTSDTSIVLTEDTDSFIIGDHVWVGGTKPGQIAYIGETKFAPGEWAGVVLDEPVGKNDGSVAGIRYFQCSAKKGVFSRLSRLTRTQLDYGGGGDSVFSSADPCSGMSTPSSRRLPLSPTGSTRDLLKKTSSPSMSSIVSATPSHHAPPGEVKVGERVIVMSSHGSKAGVLRYMGPTEFAAGEWCGVELDDPLGKNDGSVGDKRYFECGPKFGLFAPAHKVSRSPSNRKPSTAANCAVHRSSVTSATPSIRRAGSRESMMSAASTASVRSSRVVTRPGASPVKKATLQDVLKEKELHIERLLKERDLERSEVTRAASQADDAEQKLSTLQHEYEQFRDETEAKMFDIQNHLNRLQLEKGTLSGQLEDERRKVEDLQFRIEEGTIAQGDFEATNAVHLETIRDLEEKLASERLRTESFEQESTKLFETDELLAQCRAELEAVRSELNEAQTRLQCNAELLEKGGEASSVEIARLRKELDSAQTAMANHMLAVEAAAQQHKVELDTRQNQAEEIVAGLKTQLEDIKQQHASEQEALTKSLSELRTSGEAATAESQRIVKEREADIEKLTLQLQETQKLLAATSENLDKGSKAKEEVETLLQRELQELQAAVKTKSAELEIEAERVVKLGEEMQLCKTAAATVECALREKTDECDKLVSATKQLESSITQLEDSDNQRKLKIEELVSINKEQAKENQAKVASIESLQKQIVDKDKTIAAKMEELCKSQGEKDVSLQEKSSAIEHLEKQIAEKEGYYKSKTEEWNKINKEQQDLIEEKISKIDSLEGQVREVEKNMKLKAEELAKLSSEQLNIIEERKTTVEGLERVVTTKDQQIDDLRSEITALKEKLEAEAATERHQHEQEIDACKVQLKELETRLNEREDELRQLRNEIEKQSEVLQTRDEAIKKQLDEAVSLSQKLSASEETSVALSAEIHKLQLEVGELQRRLQAADEKCCQLTQQKQKLEDDISGLMGTSSDSSAQLTKMNAELRVKEQEVDRAKEATVAATQETETVKHKLLLATQHAEKTEEDLAEKLAQLGRAKEKAAQEYQVTIEKAKETEMQLKHALEDLTVQAVRDAAENKQRFEQLQKEAEKERAEMLKAVQQGKEVESVLNKKLEAVTEEAKTVENSLKKQVDMYVLKIKQAEEELKLKSELVVGTEQELKQKLEELLKQSQDTEKSLKLKHSQDLDVLAKQKAEVEAALLEADNKIAISSKEFVKQQQLLEDTKKALSETELANSTASEAVTRLEHDNTEADKIIRDQKEKLAMVNVELKSIHDEKEATEKLLSETNSKLLSVTHEVETLRNEVATTEMTASERDVRLSSTMNELQQTKKEKESAESLLAEKVSSFESLMEEFKKLETAKSMFENVASEREIQSNQFSEEIVLLKESLGKMKQDKLSVESNLVDVTSKLNITEEKLGNVNKEKEVIVCKVADSEATINQLNQEIKKLKEDFDKHRQDRAGVESHLSEKDSKLNSVLEELQKMCAEKEILEKRNAEREAELTRVSQEAKSLKECLDQKETALEKSVAEAKKESMAAGGIRDKLDFERRTTSELQEKFNETERDRLKLVAECKDLAEAAQKATELNVRLAALQKELQNTQQREQEFKTNSELEKCSIEQLLESTKSQLAERESELQKHRADVATLTVEVAEAKKYKAQLDSLQREKKQLEHKVVEMQVVQTKASLNNSAPASNQSSEDKEDPQGQIDFLNSVIVDLHRKNDDLKARIEIMEMGISAEDADELNLNGIKARMIAPRLFCDICDVFDLHDTEDCPRQAMDSPPPAETAGKPPRGPAVERSYCDICEIFGHATEDCDDGETF